MKKKFEKYYSRGRAGIRAALWEILSAEDARAFVIEYARALDAESPSTDFSIALASARNSIGYVTGDGVPLVIRQFWYKAASVRHPYLPELAERDCTAQEALDAGRRLGEQMRRAD